MLDIIRDEFEEEIREQNILLSSQQVKMPNGGVRKQPIFVLTLNQAKQVLMRESKFVRRAVIQYIEKLEQALKQPKKVEMNKLPFEYKVEIETQPKLIEIYQTENKVYYEQYGKYYNCYIQCFPLGCAYFNYNITQDS